MKPKTFSELYQQAERHEDYWVAGAILEFTEGVVREMERQGVTRTELARRLGASPAYVTKILRGKINFTLATMLRLARALDVELRVQLTGGSGRPILRPVVAAEAAGMAGTSRAEGSRELAGTSKKVQAKRARAR